MQGSCSLQLDQHCCPPQSGNLNTSAQGRVVKQNAAVHEFDKEPVRAIVCTRLAEQYYECASKVVVVPVCDWAACTFSPSCCCCCCCCSPSIAYAFSGLAPASCTSLPSCRCCSSCCCCCCSQGNCSPPEPNASAESLLGPLTSCLSSCWCMQFFHPMSSLSTPALSAVPPADAVFVQHQDNVGTKAGITVSHNCL